MTVVIIGSGNVAAVLGGKIAQRDAAKLKLAIIAAGAAGQLAAQADPHRGAVARHLRELERGVEAVLDRQRAVHQDVLEGLALRLVALGHPLTHLVAVDLGSFGHPV